MTPTSIRGQVRRFGDNVTTDDVIAGKYKHETISLDQLAPHVMENIRPGFYEEIDPGDIIVGGRNFGCGSSREQAPALIKHVGIPVVIAESFARIFYRNAINIGLALLECPTLGIEEGDLLEYDPARDRLTVAQRGIELTSTPLPEEIRAIVDAGGLLAYVKQEGSL
ncbi:MAG TPA: 3-isopropylmalate dehydratase [Solirubrobacterales bacterium]|nr:3-isopropylmalate dehydratase [Solirubrobacterales bacterium]